MVMNLTSNQGQISPPPPIQATDAASRAPQLSPSVVVIIVLITVIFFLSGFLHLLARCFARQSRREEDNSMTTLQGQLQQLFHLHDAGVEQAFIDTLPVFWYKSVRGLKEGADCAVCLAEFQGEDRLRLLPKCSHAFHLDCIDTWLLSHSTCPLCRCSLLPENPPNLPPQSSALSVESGRSTSSANFSADFALPDAIPPHPDQIPPESAPKSILPEIQNQTHDPSSPIDSHNPDIPPVLVPVKLGRFCPVDPSAPVSPRSGSKNRRSCSVGSYEYVLDPSNLQVFITPTPARKKFANFKPNTPGHRNALSECIPDRIGPFFAQNDELQFANRRLLVAENGSNRKNRAIDRPFVAFGINSNCVPNSSALQWAPWKKAPDLGFKNSASRTDLASKITASRTDLASKKCDRPAKTISFRFPAPDPKLKNSSSRRTLSESDMAPDLAWEVASSSLESVPEQLDAGSGSNKFARKALRWILRKDRRSTDRTDLV